MLGKQAGLQIPRLRFDSLSVRQFVFTALHERKQKGQGLFTTRLKAGRDALNVEDEVRYLGGDPIWVVIQAGPDTGLNPAGRRKVLEFDSISHPPNYRSGPREFGDHATNVARAGSTPAGVTSCQ